MRRPGRARVEYVIAGRISAVKEVSDLLSILSNRSSKEDDSGFGAGVVG